MSSAVSFAQSLYSPEQLDELTNLIERASRGIHFTKSDLEERLLDLMRAVGRDTKGNELAVAYREFGEDDLSHAELAVRFRAIANSDDPLNSELCNGIVLTKLNHAARRKWARQFRTGRINRPHPIRGMRSEDLTAEELNDVRGMAAHLATYHQSFVRREQPRKIDQDTLIEELADIFIEFAGLSCDRYDLAHAAGSRFIKFVYVAMRPFYGLTEASIASISKRWKRLKDAAVQAV